LKKNAISIPENGSCGSRKSFEGALRKKSFVAPGYEANETEFPFFRNLNSDERVSFIKEYSARPGDDLANGLHVSCIDF